MAGCSHIGDISVEGYQILRALPKDSRTVEVALTIKAKNNGPEIAIEQFGGTLYRKETSLGTFSVKPFRIPRKGVSDVYLEGEIVVDRNVSLLSILAIVQQFDVNDFSVDYEAVAALGALKKTLTGTKVPVSKFMSK